MDNVTLLREAWVKLPDRESRISFDLVFLGILANRLPNDLWKEAVEAALELEAKTRRREPEKKL